LNGEMSVACARSALCVITVTDQVGKGRVNFVRNVQLLAFATRCALVGSVTYTLYHRSLRAHLSCCAARPVHEGNSRTMGTYADEKSDEGIIPMKQPNKEGAPSAEGQKGPGAASKAADLGGESPLPSIARLRTASIVAQTLHYVSVLASRSYADLQRRRVSAALDKRGNHLRWFASGRAQGSKNGSSWMQSVDRCERDVFSC
jgi:hypothetical protein